MKYRRLANDELANLEQAFIRFLVVNGIEAKDWARMKNQQPTQAMEMIDIFSDMVFESSLKKVRYLQWTRPTELKLYHCQEEEIFLIMLVVHPAAQLDFTQKRDLQALLYALQKVSPEHLEVYQAKKKYQIPREQLIFELMETGCLIHDGELFEILRKVYEG